MLPIPPSSKPDQRYALVRSGELSVAHWGSVCLPQSGRLGQNTITSSFYCLMRHYEAQGGGRPQIWLSMSTRPELDTSGHNRKCLSETWGGGGLRHGERSLSGLRTFPDVLWWLLLKDSIICGGLRTDPKGQPVEWSGRSPWGKATLGILHE